MADAKNQEKGNIFLRTGKRISKWFREMRSELKKVVWPTRKELYKYTIVVLAVCAFFALFFWLLDTGFLAILEKVLKITM